MYIQHVKCYHRKALMEHMQQKQARKAETEQRPYRSLSYVKK